MTPRQFFIHVAAARDREREVYKQDAIIAWSSVMLANPKDGKFQKLESYLEDLGAIKPKTEKQKFIEKLNAFNKSIRERGG